MEATKFPDWVNTLVNGAIAGALVMGVVQIMGLRERVGVMEATIIGVIQTKEQAQRVIDVGQDGQILALQKQVESIEAKLAGPLAGLRATSSATATMETESIRPFERLTF